MLSFRGKKGIFGYACYKLFFSILLKQIIVIVTLVGAAIVGHAIARKIGDFPKVSICTFSA